MKSLLIEPLEARIAPANLTIAPASVIEGDSGTTKMIFTVTLDAASTSPVTVNFNTVAGTATAGSDYITNNGLLTFATGETSKTIEVLVNGDLTGETDEVFFVQLSNANGADLQTDLATGTILNDAKLSISDPVAITEADSGTKQLSFVVTLTEANPNNTVRVDFATVDGTGVTGALAGSDYVSKTGTLVFERGQTSKTVTVDVLGDTVGEADETFTVNLSNPVRATVTKEAGTGKILNDAKLSVSAPSPFYEAEAGTKTMDFAVTLTEADPTKTVTVHYETVNGSAVSGGDYQSQAGDLTFNPGETTKTVSVVINPDTINETDETLTLKLSQPTNAALVTAEAAGTIVDPKLSIVGPAAITEGDNGTKLVTFTVNLEHAYADRTVTVDYATQDGAGSAGAVAGSDYVAKSGTLSFAPGETTKTITVEVNGDTVGEQDENFLVRLLNPANAIASTSSASATILNDDPLLTVSAPEPILEGDTGKQQMVFTVSLNYARPGETVTVQYRTVNGTAVAGSDYDAATGTLTFAPGETTKTIVVDVNGDTTAENDETFNVELFNATNAGIGAPATGTILADPKVSIAAVSIAEGDSGTKQLVFTVTLSEAKPGGTVTLKYNTVDGTATAGSDYNAKDGTLTFAPGETTKTIAVEILGDTDGEEDELFTVQLSDISGATLATASATGTILNDAKLSIAQPAVFYEAECGTKTLDFGVTLTEAKPSGNTTVHYATANGTATAGEDYVAAAGDLTFAPGETTKTISVTVKADDVNETNETLTVALSEPTNATIVTGQATGTIVDPKLVISGPTSISETGANQTVTYTVTLEHGYSDRVTTVNYATVSGTATAGSDFVAANGMVTFGPGETSKTIDVTVIGDNVKESTESYSVQLSGSNNAVIGTGTATTSIADDELDPIYVSDVTLTEGDSGTTIAIFTITLSSAVPAGQKLVVHYSTVDGTAISTGLKDYEAATGTVTFQQNELTKTVAVTIYGDRNYEGATFVGTGAERFAADQFTLQLQSAELQNTNDNSKIRDVQFTQGSKTTGTGTIRDNDTLPTLSIADAKFLEGNGGGTSQGKFLITLSDATDYPIELVYSTQGGTATEGTDYTGGTNLTIVIPAGTKVFELPVPIAADDLDEPSEQFSLTLVSAKLKTDPAQPATQPLGITRAQAVGTIVADEIVVTLEPATSISLPEGNSGQSDLVFTVKLSKPVPAGQTVTLNYAALDGTATGSGEFADYTLPPGQLVFAAGEDTKTITVKINGDARVEGNETFKIQLTGENVSLAGSLNPIEREVTIVEESQEPEPTVSIQNITAGGQITEGGKVTFQVTLSSATDAPVEVFYSLEDGTAKSGDNGNDYTNGTNLKVVIPAGATTATFTVDTFDDVLNEGTETFTAKIESVTNALIQAGSDVATGTIADNDALPTLNVGNAKVVEGDSGTKTLEYTVRLSAASGRDVTFTAATVNGTAVAGQDYVAKEQTITIPAGQTTATFQVVVNGDTVNETDETVFVRLSNAENATIGSEGVGTIQNDESKLEIRYFNPLTGQFDLTSISVDEEAGANHDQDQVVRFKIFRTGDLSNAVSVDFSTADGVDRGTGDDRVRGAVGSGSRADFVATSGSVTFAANTTPGVTEQSSQEFSFKINQDGHYEKLEEFFVRLNNSVNAAPSTVENAGRIQIVDNEALPTLTISNVTVDEGNATNSTPQQTSAVFKATLSHVDETGTWQLVQKSIDGTGQNGAISTATKRDFNALDSTLTFAPGEISKNVTVTVLGDNRDEYDETFQVQLTGKNSVGGDITPVTGTGTITDDDAEAVVSITNLTTGSSSATYAEADLGSTSKFFKVSLTGETDKVVTVKYSTLDGSGLGGAVAGEDFVGKEGLLTFDPNNPDTAARTAQNVYITIINDTIVEGAQSFEVNLAEATNAKMGDSRGVATIADDVNDKPIFTITDVSLVEGDNPLVRQTANFAVVLAAAAQKPITLNFTTADGTGKATGAFADYIAQSGQLVFAPGETNKEVQVEVISDQFMEKTQTTDFETFQLKLSGLASNNSDVVFANNNGVGTAKILNGNDTVVGIGINDVSVVENGRDSNGGATTSTANFTVELSTYVPNEVKVTAAVRSGTAIKGLDFANTTSVVTIPANTLSATFNVAITSDNSFEPTETFFVDLSQIPTGIVGGKTTGKGTIYNDDVRQVNPRTVQWIDVDGDLVTLKVSKGELNIFNSNQFSFYDAGSTVGGLSLQILNLNSNDFANANVSITAKPQPGFTGDRNGVMGDGRVDVGFIRAGVFADSANFFGVDLGTVKIEGDLGKIEVGDRFIDGISFRKLDVHSIGMNPLQEGLGSYDNNNQLVGVETTSYIQGKVGAIKVRTDVSGAIRVIGAGYGDIGSLFIGGTLLGNEYSSSGSISFSGTLAHATIGNIVGGSGAASGRIDADSTYNANIGRIQVKGEVVGGSGANSGVVAATRIKSLGAGAILGGSGDDSGQVRAGTINNAFVERDVAGGSGARSGLLLADSGFTNAKASLGKTTVNGRIIGGSGTDSGVVGSDGNLNSLTVRGKYSSSPDAFRPDVTAAVSGGSGATSGRIHSSGTIGNLEIIGNAGVSLLGGDGNGSGKITAGKINHFTLDGDIRGAAVSSTGLIDVQGSINSMLLKGDLIGGNSRGDSPDASLSGVNTTGAIVAGRIGSLRITGDLVSGVNTGEGLGGSGSIAAQGPIGKLVIQGDVVGNSSRAVNILAFGGADVTAIGKLQVGGDVSFTNIFTGTSIRNTNNVSLVNADAQINSVVISGNVKGLNITAGANAGPDGVFGTADDRVASNSQGEIDEEKVYSRIASVIIKGQVQPVMNDTTASPYGIIAQHVVKVKVGSTKVPLTAGPGNDTADNSTDPNPGVEIVPGSGFRVIELPIP